MFWSKNSRSSSSKLPELAEESSSSAGVPDHVRKNIQQHPSTDSLLLEDLTSLETSGSSKTLQQQLCRVSLTNSHVSQTSFHSEIKHKKEREESIQKLEKTIAKFKESYVSEARLLAQTADAYGQLPLHTAMEFGRKGVTGLVELLVQLYPQAVHTPNIYGNLPIHLLGPKSKDGASAVEILLEKYPESATKSNKMGQLPLHFATSRGHAVTTKVLLNFFEGGLRIPDNDGWLPIHYACHDAKRTEIIKLLVSAYPECLKTKNKAGNLPIHVAIYRCRQVELLDFLIDSYPGCLGIENKSGELPLHQALIRNYSCGDPVVQLLYKKFPPAVEQILETAIKKQDYDLIDKLAHLCPDIFDTRCSCTEQCDCLSKHPILKFLQTSGLRNWRLDTVACLLSHSGNRLASDDRSRDSSSSADAILGIASAYRAKDQTIAGLTSKLEAVQAGKDHLTMSLKQEQARSTQLSAQLVDSQNQHDAITQQYESQISELQTQLEIATIEKETAGGPRRLDE